MLPPRRIPTPAAAASLALCALQSPSSALPPPRLYAEGEEIWDEGDAEVLVVVAGIMGGMGGIMLMGAPHRSRSSSISSSMAMRLCLRRSWRSCAMRCVFVEGEPGGGGEALACVCGGESEPGEKERGSVCDVNAVPRGVVAVAVAVAAGGCCGCGCGCACCDALVLYVDADAAEALYP
ncbi:uncharacterized protein BKA78DRAFT_310485 [Phyllosticta capitalensis]|uniref:uncharacterized protein n=1 Tax=Phyllosticta capitalensis TaxID=121624 RepID=UPI003132720F